MGVRQLRGARADVLCCERVQSPSEDEKMDQESIAYEVHRSAASRLEPPQVKQLLHEYDSKHGDGDGKLSFEEVPVLSACALSAACAV